MAHDRPDECLAAFLFSSLYRKGLPDCPHDLRQGTVVGEAGCFAWIIEKGLAMYKSILVPVALEHEDNEDSAKAVVQALRADGGKVTLLHVMPEIPGYVAAYIPEGTFERNHKEAVAEMNVMAEKYAGGAEVQVVTGHTSQAILSCAKESGADLIVIASHRPGFEQLLLGSTASHVVRHATCAVHVIR